MRRREFIALVGSTVALPLGVQAQQPGIPVIGFLHSASPVSYASQLDAFRIYRPGTVADQPADLDEVTKFIHRRNPIACCQIGDSIAFGEKE
jgi:hypothetical protein